MTRIKNIPKFEQLKNILEKEIAGGKYLAGDKIPSEYELSASYGLNRSTVNKAISGLVAEGLAYRNPGNGTFVAKKKSPAERAKLPVIAVSVPERGFSIIDNIPSNCVAYLEGISAEAAKNACLFKIHRNSEPPPADVSGIISIGYLYDENRAFQISVKNNIPLVSIACHDNGTKGNLIVDDSANAFDKAISYCVEKGCRDIACLKYSNDPECLLREKILKEAINKNGPELNDKFSFLCPDVEETEKSISSLLEHCRKPFVLFMLTDYLAIWAMKYLKEKNIRIPEDVLPVCIDDARLNREYSINLSTVGIPQYKMGMESVKMMLELLENPRITGKRKYVKAEFTEGTI